MCTVLCSLLLGAGFDAYMVAGYAPLPLTLSDQTQAGCPLLEPEPLKSKPLKMQPAASHKHPTQPKEAKYKIRSDAKPESAFLQVIPHVHAARVLTAMCSAREALRRSFSRPFQ